MDALGKVERSKIYPAAEAAILNKYITYYDIPKWSEIRTLVRKSLRAYVISQLEITDNGDVAEYLKLHEHEIDGFLHRKVETLREKGVQSQLKKENSQCHVNNDPQEPRRQQIPRLPLSQYPRSQEAVMHAKVSFHRCHISWLTQV